MTIFGQKKMFEAGPTELGSWSLGHWTPRKLPFCHSVKCFLLTRYIRRSFMEQTGVTIVTESIFRPHSSFSLAVLSTILCEVTQLCLTLCSPMDCSLPGFSVYGIFQARVLEWGAISFSRGSSPPRDQTRVSHIVGRCFTIILPALKTYEV